MMSQRHFLCAALTSLPRRAQDSTETRHLNRGNQKGRSAASPFYPSKCPKCLQEALGHLKESVERFNTQGPLPKHPVFGKLTKEQTTQLNCKHCAMHLSFVHPTKA